MMLEHSYEIRGKHPVVVGNKKVMKVTRRSTTSMTIMKNECITSFMLHTRSLHRGAMLFSSLFGIAINFYIVYEAEYEQILTVSYSFLPSVIYSATDSL